MTDAAASCCASCCPACATTAELLTGIEGVSCLPVRQIVLLG